MATWRRLTHFWEAELARLATGSAAGAEVVHAAEVSMRHIQHEKVRPSAHMYNALALVYVRAGDRSGALRALKRMRKKYLHEDAVTHAIMAKLGADMSEAVISESSEERALFVHGRWTQSHRPLLQAEPVKGVRSPSEVKWLHRAGRLPTDYEELAREQRNAEYFVDRARRRRI